MATQFFMTAPTNGAGNGLTADQNFRLWGGGLSAALAACGLVLQDTSINWSTVLAPTATNTFMGYEIWRFNDTLQATVPCFIKIRYGSSGGAAATPQIEITVGQSYSSGGTLTGNLSDVFTATPGSNNTTLFPCVVSGANNRLTFAMWVGNGSTAMLVFGFARTKDSAGADTSAGVNIVQASASIKQQFLPAGGVKFPATSLDAHVATVMYAASSLSGNYGGEMGVYPVCPWRGMTDYPDLSFVMYNNNDAGANQILPVYVLGAVHNFYTIGNNQTDGAMPNASIGIRYE